MEECDQSNASVSDKFRVAIPHLGTFFLEVSVPVLFKVATKAFFRGKKPEKFAFLRLFF